jgi:hypothetical protein
VSVFMPIGTYRLPAHPAQSIINRSFASANPSSEIGLYPAKLLAIISTLPRIVVVCRNREKSDYAVEQIIPLLPQSNGDYYKENFIPIVYDHSS